ncbi:MAG TPA: ROK family protein [Nitrospirae bacterium]|nr:glucokinase [bacterium BMS3Abin06]HDH12884.1 ROK family protein [Nitrospirota bacterium]HDZ00492.1 ROK family protein [Nitrospirota bacterium]
MNIAIGMDIGGTNTKIVLAYEDGKVLCSRQTPTPSVSEKSPEKIDALLVNSLKDFLADDSTRALISASPQTADIVGIGIGVAGLIDRKNGKVIESPNMSALDGLPLKEKFEKEFSLPVVLENDANTYAYGEKWIGAGKDFDNFVVLTLGTGLGGGLIYNGALYEGPVEIGHMVVVPSGRYCTCGSYGCLESYASGRAIVDRAVSSLEKGTESLLAKCCDGNFYKITPQVVYETALEGDSLSREVFREVGQFLGIGIANLINILNLEAVIIGGGLIGAWDLFIAEVKKEVSKRAFKPLSANVKILKSALTKDAGSVGAAGLLFKKIDPAGGVPRQSAS